MKPTAFVFLTLMLVGCSQPQALQLPAQPTSQPGTQALNPDQQAGSSAQQQPAITGSAAGPTAAADLLAPSATPTPLPQGERLIRAPIENIDIRVEGEYPPAIIVAASGVLMDDCTSIGPSFVERSGQDFTIDVLAVQDLSAECSLISEPFLWQIDLDAEQLQQGAYRVELNGLRQTFELAYDGLVQPTELADLPFELENPPGVASIPGERDEEADPPLNPDGPPPAPETGPDGTAPSPVQGLAFVEGVEAALIYSTPKEVLLTISGSLANPCTQITATETRRAGGLISVTLVTETDATIDCPDVLAAFEKQLVLPFSFPPGEYELTINDYATSFTVPE